MQYVSIDIGKSNGGLPHPTYDCNTVRVWNIFGNDGEQFVPSVCPAADTPATLLEDGEECLACVITRWGRRKFKRFFYNCGKLYFFYLLG